MDGIAEKMLAGAIDGLARLDVDLARGVVAANLHLDSLRRQIEQRLDGVFAALFRDLGVRFALERFQFFFFEAELFADRAVTHANRKE